MYRTSICDILRKNKLADKLKKVINKPNKKKPIKPIKPNKKNKENKKINIIREKYSLRNNSTHMDKINFYSKYYIKDKIENFYLSNGCNKLLDSGWSGTNLAITNISHDFFNIKYIKVIYNNNLDLNKIYSHSNQKLTKKIIGLNAGSVLFSNFNFNFNDYNICGVYHINGVNWNNINRYKDTEETEENKTIVKNYYIKLIEHFIDNSLDKSLLYLAQIPGDRFKGGQGTINGIKEAIKVIEKKETNKNLTIVFDLE